MTNRLRCGAGALFLSLSLAAPLAAEEVPRDEARALFNRGLALVDSERFEEAAARFEQAYALQPHAAVLYNIAKAHAAARHLALAARAFQRYLDNAEELPPARRQEVQAELLALEARLGRLEITTRPSNAELRVDGRLLEPGAQAFDPGPHHVSASAHGYAPMEREVLIAVGETAEVSIELEPTQKIEEPLPRAPTPVRHALAEAEAVSRPVAPPSRAPSNHRRLWLAGSTGGAGLLLAGVTIGLVLDNGARYDRWQTAQDELDTEWRTLAVGPSEQQQQNDTLAQRIKLQDQVATGVGVASAACVVAALAIWFVNGDQPSSAGARARLVAQRGGGNLILTW